MLVRAYLPFFFDKTGNFNVKLFMAVEVPGLSFLVLSIAVINGILWRFRVILSFFSA